MILLGTCFLPGLDPATISCDKDDELATGTINGSRGSEVPAVPLTTHTAWAPLNPEIPPDLPCPMPGRNPHSMSPREEMVTHPNSSDTSETVNLPDKSQTAAIKY